MTAGRNEVTPPYKITFRIIFIIVRTLTWGETMETITFTADLERNIRMMQELFRNDDTLIIRRAIGQNGLRCALFFFDGMVNSLAINQSLVRPILRCEQPRLSADILAAAVLQADECRVETDMNKVFAAFLYGDAIVLTDGDARPVLVNTKGFDKRSTAEPENERVLSGPREGFTECFMPNLALIRRRVNDPRLKFRFMRVGSRTNTNVCLCYIAGLCENSLVERLETRLTALDIDSVLDSNYLAERIRDHRWSPFPTLGTTERPDVAASRMLEGRCVIVVDGSPVALTAPFLFQECFQSNDDYYISFAGESFAHPACHRICIHDHVSRHVRCAHALSPRISARAAAVRCLRRTARRSPSHRLGDSPDAVRARGTQGSRSANARCHGTDDEHCRRSGAR